MFRTASDKNNSSKPSTFGRSDHTAIRPKLEIGQANDVACRTGRYEQEADAMADHVMSSARGPVMSDRGANGGAALSATPGMVNSKDEEEQLQMSPLTPKDSIRMMHNNDDDEETLQMSPLSTAVPLFPSSPLSPHPSLQMKCHQCEDEGNKVQMMPAIQRSADGKSYASPALSSQLSGSKGKGHPLPDNTRAFMESGFGADFSDVKIHDDKKAADMSRGIGAKAFTHGNDIYFNKGQYDPGSRSGKHLLAHELTHTIQQNGKARPAAIRKADNGQQTGNREEVDNTIGHLELALQVAENTLHDPDLRPDKREEIEVLFLKLSSVMPQLYEAKGTGNVSVSFDIDPAQNEINPGDAGKSTEQLYAGFSVQRPAGTNQAAGKIQTKAEAGGLNISQTAGPQIQRFCDPIICGAIIILGGLLLSGCQSNSDEAKEKPPEAKKREQKQKPPEETKPKDKPKTEPKTTTGKTRTFALTFDDGPHAGALGKGTNRTEMVLDTLKTKGIKAGFFIQTGVNYRGANAIGIKLVKRMHDEGHILAVHTGGTEDHELHTKAAKKGTLEKELESAKDYITEHTGEGPKYVRPPTGAFNEQVTEVYKKVKLTNLMWDIDGDSGKNLSLTDLKSQLKSQITVVKNRDWKGTTAAAPKIVVLYHDIQKGSATNIGTLIEEIKKLTKDLSGGKDTANFDVP